MYQLCLNFIPNFHQLFTKEELQLNTYNSTYSLLYETFRRSKITNTLMNNILYRIPQLSSSKDPEYNKLFRDIKTFRARENAKQRRV